VRLKIGIFDSGIGGFTILNSLLKTRKDVEIIYLADTKRIPFGSKNFKEIRLIAKEICNFFADKNLHALLVACNTTNACALDILENNLKVPCFDLINSVSEIVDKQIIGVLATQTTVRSSFYKNAISSQKDNSKIFQQECPEFVSEIEKEKLELIHGLNSGGSLILNEDISINKSIKNFSKKNNIELIKFGQKDKSNNFLINYRYFPDGSLIEANFDTISLSFKMFAPGLHMALNAIAVLSVCNILDLPLGFIIKKLTKFNPVEGRGLTYDLSFQNKKIKIIDESFNANPESMISSINLLNDMDAFENNRKILILGDMLELGKFSREYHIKIARFINKTNINLVFCSGKRMKYLWDNLSKNKKGAFAENPEELIKPLTEKIINKDIFLIKGSSNSKIKIILSYLNNENLIREIA